ncbi:MAG: hypothetical protein HC812_12020 [Leptolyngbya sp. RL_3_1]|nr:hypothetical protein [Leptolyngbya sp. RL_3_1]
MQGITGWWALLYLAKATAETPSLPPPYPPAPFLKAAINPPSPPTVTLLLSIKKRVENQPIGFLKITDVSRHHTKIVNLSDRRNK